MRRQNDLSTLLITADGMLVFAQGPEAEVLGIQEAGGRLAFKVKD